MREKRANHNTAQPANISKNTTSFSDIAASKGVYIHKTSSKKLPEIPGRIIAHIHMAADNTMYQAVGSPLQGWRNPTNKATKPQTTKGTTDDKVNKVSFLLKKKIDASTKPKKNPRTSSGVVSILCSNTLENKTTLVSIHKKSKRRKLPFQIFRAFFIFPENTSFTISIWSTFLILVRSVSYTQVISATVHQLTQGTKSQTHISIHTKKFFGDINIIHLNKETLFFM